MNKKCIIPNEIIKYEVILQNNLSSNDISGLENINELYESLLIKKWIKLIPTNKTILFEKYNRKEYFYLVVDIILDSDPFITDKKEKHTKKEVH